MEPLVGIVILNYNTYQDTLELVKKIHAELAYKNYEIIVVDNASPNESAVELEKYKDIDQYTFIPNQSNTGYAAGNNVGIRYAVERGAKYSWILNNDIVITDVSCLSKLVALMESNEKIGVVNPRIINVDGTEDLQYVERPTCWDLTFGCFGYRNRRRAFHSEENFRTYRPHGCCMLLSNKIMQDVDYMDERTFLYCEEDILAERLLKKGYECWCDVEVSVIHNHSKTTYSALKKKGIVQNTLNSYRIYLEDYRQVKNPVLKHLILQVKGMIIYRSY